MFPSPAQLEVQFFLGVKWRQRVLIQAIQYKKIKATTHKKNAKPLSSPGQLLKWNSCLPAETFKTRATPLKKGNTGNSLGKKMQHFILKHVSFWTTWIYFYFYLFIIFFVIITISYFLFCHLKWFYSTSINHKISQVILSPPLPF